MPEAKEPTEPAPAYQALREKIELCGVGFKYPNRDEYAVSGLSLTLRRGEMLAVLGENGSGKTTLVKLILGMLPAAEGEVLFDCISVKELDIQALCRGVSVVAQDFVRYQLTPRDNIAVSDADRAADDASVSAALRSVGPEPPLDTPGLDGELGTAFGGGDISG
jgi:ABC-type bacteriocin/lantibiotic exporter with double-glycine peptidase domain